MTTTTDKPKPKIPTPDEIREQCARAMDRVSRMVFHVEYTIDDYPVGRRLRARCKIGVDDGRWRGNRTVKATSDQRGYFHKPKRGVYRKHPLIVASNTGGKWPVAWLGLDPLEGMYFQYANGETVFLVKAPYWRPTKRNPEKYTTKTTTMFSDAPTEIQEHVIPADPPELCDAWEAWEECYGGMAETIVARIKHVRGAK